MSTTTSRQKKLLSSKEQYLKIIEEYPLVKELKDRLKLGIRLLTELLSISFFCLNFEPQLINNRNKLYMAEVIRMPLLSDTMTEGKIITWNKKVGDKVKADDVLADVETDKAPWK